MTPKDAWSATYHQLELQLDRASFESFLKTATFVSYEGGVYHIQVNNDYARDMCQHRLYRNIRRVLSDVVGEACEINFELAPKAQPAHDSGASFFSSASQSQEPDVDQQDLAQQADQTKEYKSWMEFFARIPEAVVDTLSVTHIGMLAKFVRHINRKFNTLVGSMEDLSKLFEVPQTTLKKYTKDLIEYGVLACIPGRGRGHANTYCLAGRMAIAVCGAEVAQRTMSKIEKHTIKRMLQTPPQADQAPDPAPAQLQDETPPEQPAAHENAPEAAPVSNQDEAAQPDKGVQIRPANEQNVTPENGPNPTSKNKVVEIRPANTDKVDQIRPASADKVDQFGPPIQTFNDLPDINKNKTHARAHEAADPLPPPADSANSQNSKNQNQSESKPKRRLPKYPTAHAWLTAFRLDTTDDEIAAIKAIDEQYDPHVIDRALAATIMASKRQSFRGDRLHFFKQALERDQSRTDKSKAAVS